MQPDQGPSTTQTRHNPLQRAFIVPVLEHQFPHGQTCIYRASALSHSLWQAVQSGGQY